jgi:hypothetical protein
MFTSLPTWVSIFIAASGWLVSSFAGRLPERIQDLGLYLGMVLFCIGGFGMLQHLGLHFFKGPRGPVNGMALGLSIFLGCAGWYYLEAKASSPNDQSAQSNPPMAPQPKSAPKPPAAAPQFQQNVASGGIGYQAENMTFNFAIPPELKIVEVRPVKSNGDGTFTLSELVKVVAQSQPINMMTKVRGDGVIALAISGAPTPGENFYAGGKGAGYNRKMGEYFVEKFNNPNGHYLVSITTTKSDAKPEVSFAFNVD